MIVGVAVSCWGLWDISNSASISRRKHVPDLTNQLKSTPPHPPMLCTSFFRSCRRSFVLSAHIDSRSRSTAARLAPELRAAESHKQDLACCLREAALPGSHGADEPWGLTCLWQIRCDLQRPEKCRVHQLNMCAFVNSAQSWDVGIFKWVNNVVRLYLCALYKSLNAHYRLFRVPGWLALSRRFLPSLNFFFSTYSAVFSLLGPKPPFLAKKYICTCTNFLSRGITPLVSAEVRFGCRDRGGSRNSNLIPFQAGLILSLLVCVMLGMIGTSTLP